MSMYSCVLSLCTDRMCLIFEGVHCLEAECVFVYVYTVVLQEEQGYVCVHTPPEGLLVSLLICFLIGVVFILYNS